MNLRKAAAKNKKTTLSAIVTFILFAWGQIQPNVELILGQDSQALAYIGLVITVISLAYNYFINPEESMFKTARRKLGM